MGLEKANIDQINTWQGLQDIHLDLMGSLGSFEAAQAKLAKVGELVGKVAAETLKKAGDKLNATTSHFPGINEHYGNANRLLLEAGVDQRLDNEHIRTALEGFSKFEDLADHLSSLFNGIEPVINTLASKQQVAENKVKACRRATALVSQRESTSGVLHFAERVKGVRDELDTFLDS